MPPTCFALLSSFPNPCLSHEMGPSQEAAGRSCARYSYVNIFATKICVSIYEKEETVLAALHSYPAPLQVGEDDSLQQALCPQSRSRGSQLPLDTQETYGIRCSRLCTHTPGLLLVPHPSQQARALQISTFFVLHP